jgi:L-ascorbate metabolism protein UlaG (beta-lactamase superfamily)
VVKIKYLGHSSFLISSADSNVLIDPFLTGNPMAAMSSDELTPDLILVTHGHEDHLGDAIEISKRTGSTILGTFEVANYCSSKGANVRDGHIGGVAKFPFGLVKFFNAVHSSSAGDGTPLGNPCSFVIVMDGKAIYHAGDTALFGDMALIAEEFDLDLAILPVGGHYTMGIDDAVRAEKLLNAKNVVPMHYDTFDVIKADVADFCRKIEGQTKAKCAVLRPGEELSI